MSQVKQLNTYTWLGFFLEIAKASINPELQGYLHRDPKVYEQLTQDLFVRGVRGSFVFNTRPDGTTVLLDGYTRLDIILNNLDQFDLNQMVAYEFLNLPTAEEEKVWMIRNNTRRRSLSKEQVILHYGELFESVKSSSGRPSAQTSQLN